LVSVYACIKPTVVPEKFKGNTLHAVMPYRKGFQEICALTISKQMVLIIHEILGVSQNVVKDSWEYVRFIKYCCVYGPGLKEKHGTFVASHTCTFRALLSFYRSERLG
jgi:hypothetical protein